MSYTLTLPDDLYRALQRYAEQQQQTPAAFTSDQHFTQAGCVRVPMP